MAAITYHLEKEPGGAPVCPADPALFADADVLVPPSEANAPGGRWINCVECHKILTGGHAHVPPPDPS